jgi:acetolactate synthase I/II/III large subunit
VLVAALVRCGLDTVFGFPGDTSVAFYDALSRRRDAIRYLLAHDERHAGYMADAYARTRRRLAVCEASSGAGAVYLASGLGESFAASIPVLAITTDNPRGSRGTAAISEIDQEKLFEAVTKWRRCAGHAAELPGLVAEAAAAAVTGRPGPAVLIIPEEVLTQEVAAADLTACEPAAAQVPGQRPAASPAAVAAAAAHLAAAQRPVLVAGGGVHLSGAWPALQRLAEHAALPVATTIHGKGALDEAHPLALGVIGGNGARDYANTWVADSDLVLFAGTRANATDTMGFTVPARGRQPVIHIEIDGERAGRNYPESLPLAGDVATVLEQLRAQVPAAASGGRARRAAEVAAAARAWERQQDPEPVTPPGVLHPRHIVKTLHARFGGRTWLVADAGTPTPYLSCYWQPAGGAWRVVIPRGHGAMGYAIPASIGIAAAHPGDRVLCLTTENSAAMALAEWETARRLGLPVTYAVLDNRSLAWIKMIQHLYLGRRYFAVDPGPIDPVQLARGMGVPGARARDVNELDVLAKEAIGRAGPSVIHVAVPEHMDVPPPVPPWLAALSGQSTGRLSH